MSVVIRIHRVVIFQGDLVISNTHFRSDVLPIDGFKPSIVREDSLAIGDLMSGLCVKITFRRGLARLEVRVGLITRKEFERKMKVTRKT